MGATLTIGSTLAGYRIEALIGRGGMGVVYRATDLRLERPVALKLIAPERAEEPGFRSRFLHESRIAASLDHPNVIPIYEAGEADGALFIAMRYVEGSDLKSLLRDDGRLQPDRALELLAQIAGALDAAHARGLVHRDVKPANILVDGTGHVYLSDFGLTKLTDEATSLSAPGQLLGTLEYLSPEQIRGEPLDGRADVYALGCVLYECVSGTPPFRGTEAEVLWAHMQVEPPAVGVPELEYVIRRALAKDRDERFRSCRQLVAAARGDRADRSTTQAIPATTDGRPDRSRRGGVGPRGARRRARW
jgi:serine/threonine-protein kinase